jgi:hypothetical protein
MRRRPHFCAMKERGYPNDSQCPGPPRRRLATFRPARLHRRAGFHRQARLHRSHPQ